MKNQRGDTIVEVIVGLAILAMVLTSAHAITSLAFRQNISARERSQVVQLMQQQAEALRNMRDNSDTWADFISVINAISCAPFRLVPDGNTWAVDTALNPPTIDGQPIVPELDLSITVDCPITNQVKATISASWPPLGGGPDNTSSLTTLLVDKQL